MLDISPIGGLVYYFEITKKCQHAHKCKHTSEDCPKLSGTQVDINLQHTHTKQTTLGLCSITKANYAIGCKHWNLGSPSLCIYPCATIDHRGNNLLMVG